ncbi:MAG: hypothetical protein AAF368_18275, partial [Planctomycetota bacterium]
MMAQLERQAPERLTQIDDQLSFLDRAAATPPEPSVAESEDLADLFKDDPAFKKLRQLVEEIEELAVTAERLAPKITEAWDAAIAKHREAGDEPLAKIELGNAGSFDLYARGARADAMQLGLGRLKSEASYKWQEFDQQIEPWREHTIARLAKDVGPGFDERLRQVERTQASLRTRVREATKKIDQTPVPTEIEEVFGPAVTKCNESLRSLEAVVNGRLQSDDL